MPYIDWLGKDDVVHHHKEIPYKTIDCQEVVGDEDSDNLIIKGDNLLALKSLLPYYANAVKMIHIDPKEEYEVAKYIDGLEEVTTWVRNISRDHENAFWLQTSTDKFYPDFIIRLENGKTVVSEYKGADRKTNDDTKEKALLGELWASQADELEFLMLYVDDYREKLKSVLGQKNG